MCLKRMNNLVRLLSWYACLWLICILETRPVSYQHWKSSTYWQQNIASHQYQQIDKPLFIRSLSKDHRELKTRDYLATLRWIVTELWPLYDNSSAILDANLKIHHGFLNAYFSFEYDIIMQILMSNTAGNHWYTCLRYLGGGGGGLLEALYHKLTHEYCIFTNEHPILPLEGGSHCDVDVVFIVEVLPLPQLLQIVDAGGSPLHLTHHERGQDGLIPSIWHYKYIKK